MGISPSDGIGVSMEEEACVAEEESYRLLASGEGFRMGVLTERRLDATTGAAFEVLVRLFRTGARLDGAEMDRATALVRALVGRGYSVSFQDDGWVACERRAGDAEAEARWVQGLLVGR